MTAVSARTTAAANVVAGWLGVALPPVPKHRNKTRASYRKTLRKRPPATPQRPEQRT